MRRLGVAAALLLAWLSPVLAQEQTHCLTREQQRAAIAEGWAVPLAAALRALKPRFSGEVVRARLCQEPDRLIYMLTVLARDGKVKRATVDAATGAIVGER
jgi:uncharacterized membrane protein YkoI